MIKYQDKDLAVFPCFNLGVGKKFTGTGAGQHNGQDWTYVTKPYTWVMAIQDGTVKEVGYSGVTSQIGYYCTIEHLYSDGTKRITGYIHLYEMPVVKVGQTVKAGQQIGYRGGSPYQNGKAMFSPHLHLYVTKPISTSIAYSWNNMKKYADDPLKLKYTKLKAEKSTYTFAEKDGYNFGKTAEIYEDCLYVEVPIEKQLEEARNENNKLNAMLHETQKDLSEALKSLHTREEQIERIKTITNE